MKCYFYLRHPTGELISRLENDVNLTEVFASHLLVSLINEALMVVYTLSAIAVLNVYLAFGVFAVFLLLLFVQKRYSTRVRASALRTREAQANLLATLQETLSGLEWIQNVAGERKAAIRYIHRAKKVIMRNLEGTRISVIASSILGLNGNDHVWCWRIFGTKGCFYARHVGSI
jgi:ABC-type multidrug transport system, ATPase and permease components